MPFAVTLRLDPISAATIEHLWRALALAGIDADRDQLGYAPHVTLAIYPDETPVDRLCAVVDEVAERWDALPVAFGGLGVFPGPDSFLWVAPVVTPELLARQDALLAALPDEPHAHYRAGAWMPHITLSGGLRDPGRALAVLTPLWRPVGGNLDRLDLLRFRPVEVLRSHALPV